MADKNREAQINVEFDEPTSRQQLISGETINILLGKIKKIFSDLNPVAFSGNYNDLDNSPIHFGTTEYWNSQVTLIGELSHLYVYTDYGIAEVDGKSVSIPNIKIGDGNAYLIDNPFITTSVEKLLQLHAEDNTKHITDDERSAWNDKVRCYINPDDAETVVFTTN